jgi:hypothetical protein
MNEATETTIAEPVPEPQIKDPGAVLAKNKELLSRNARLGEDLGSAQARIAELEAQIQSFAADYAEMQSKFSDFHIRRPLARLAEEISPIPDVWIAEFQKNYDVKAVGDDLGIFTKDGQRCVTPKGWTGEGQPVKFTARDVWGMLAYFVPDKSAPDVKRWAAMTNYFGPTGGGAPGSSSSAIHHSEAPVQGPKPANSPAFGLR